MYLKRAIAANLTEEGIKLFFLDLSILKILSSLKHPQKTKTFYYKNCISISKSKPIIKIQIILTILTTSKESIDR